MLAAAFLAAVHQLEHLLWDELPEALGSSSPPWYLVVGLPVAGACVVLVARRYLPGDGGHEPLDGLSMKPTPLASAPGVALAAVGTLAFGAVLGPEAPLIALGSVVGVVVTAFVRLGERENAVLATAGSFSAVSAIFGGPIVAGVLLMEAGISLGAALVPVLLPGFVAAAVGYLVFVGLGGWSGIDQATLTVPGLPPYDGTSIEDLLVGLGVGIAAGLVAASVRRFGGAVAGERRRLGSGGLLLAGAVAVGLLAQAADWLGAGSQGVLFSGQSFLPALVAEDSAKVVVVLVAAKAIAYALSLGCGFRGGPVFPAIFLGIALAMLAVQFLDVSPTLAVAVGAAAGMAAMTRLLLSSLVLSALLVGTQGVDAVPAAVLAAAAAWIVTAALERRAGREDAAGAPGPVTSREPAA